MKKHFAFSISILCFSVLSFGQSIFSNTIDGINPNQFNPFVIGQIVDPNITVSGIGRSDSIYEVMANNRYNAKSWKSDELDPNAYFEFTLMPNLDRKIDFTSFVFTGQSSQNGPTLFAFRSSVDGFASNIGAVSETGATISLLGTAFQNVTRPITFRLYGWAAIKGTGAFSVNKFQFNGVVSCTIPKAPILAETNTNCTATSFVVAWPASLHTAHYFIDIASDADFIHALPSYQNKAVGTSLSENVKGSSVGGTYYIRLQSANSCATSSYSNSIKVGPPETIFNGTWSNGIPDISKKVRFSRDFNLDSDFEACSCQIDIGVAVHVDSGVVLRLENELKVLGILTFENNASLIQTNNRPNLNSGSIIYKRVSTPMKNLDFTRWSAPVFGQTIGALVPLSTRAYSWGTDNWIVEGSNTVMGPPGKGFTIRLSSNIVSGTATYSESVQFVGVPNNGPYSLVMNSIGQYNLIGNPYPSALSADAFLKANSVDNPVLEGTLYFWTHNTAASASGYSSADYATYNFTGGVAGSGTAAPSSGNKTVPSGFIAAGEGFFAVSKNGGSIVFNNSMRVGAGNAVLDNSQFFRGTRAKTTTVEKHRVWLNLTNAGGAFKQMLVGYISGATAGYDSGFDGENFNGNSFVNFYSINEKKTLTIEGRGLPFDASDQVPLGFSTTIAGTFDISIDHVDGSLINQPVYVEDKMTNVIHNLKNGPYSFSTPKGTFNDRFVLRYSDKAVVESTLGNQIVDVKEKRLVISVKNHKIKINSFDETINNVMLYDLKGSLLYEKGQLNANEFIIPNFNSSDQFQIVMVQLSNGKWISKEIFF